MKVRGSHAGQRVFVKGIRTSDFCKYTIWEHTLRMENEMHKNIYEVVCEWHDGTIISTWLYENYEKAVEMMERFTGLRDD